MFTPVAYILLGFIATVATLTGTYLVQLGFAARKARACAI